MAKTVPNGESFELEHIIAKKYFEAADEKTRQALFGNSIGNCMFLPKGLNNRKKAKTLYEVNTDERYTKLITESFYFSEQDLEDAIGAIASGNRELANSIIKRRAKLIADDTVRILLI